LAEQVRLPTIGLKKETTLNYIMPVARQKLALKFIPCE